MIKRFRIHAALLATVLAVASPAQAGGGCHSGASNGSGTTVEMKNMCFTPTVLHVRPGDSVTFVNRDEMQHTVTGTSELFGSYTALTPGQSATYRFAANGVYAYSCIFHPGMTGAVVVGDGSGAGLATGVQPVSVRPAPAPVAASKPASPVAPPPPWAWLIAAALVAGGATGFVFARQLKGPAGS